MSTRKVEIFSAGCPLCEDTIQKVKQESCSSCDVEVIDMQSDVGVKRAQELGVKSVPAVAINGSLSNCCSGRGPDMEKIKAAGLGKN